MKNRYGLIAKYPLGATPQDIELGKRLHKNMLDLNLLNNAVSFAVAETRMRAMEFFYGKENTHKFAEMIELEECCEC